MSLTVVLIVIFVLGVAGGVYAFAAPRRKAAALAPDRAPLHADTEGGADEEFAGLSETARCEMIFAAGALDDERSQRLLEHGLGDPSEAVATAAAHALASRG